MAAAAPFLLCLSFLQPTPRPPRAEPVSALQGPHAASARPRDAGSAALLGGLRRGAASGKHGNLPRRAAHGEWNVREPNDAASRTGKDEPAKLNDIK